jgi:hypothetical protein
MDSRGRMTFRGCLAPFFQGALILALLPHFGPDT